MTEESYDYVMNINTKGTLFLTQLVVNEMIKNEGTEKGSIVNISSSRDRMSQGETESYTAAKGGIAALTHALAVSFAQKVRVNSISPGWIDTSYKVYEGADAIQHPSGRVGVPPDISNMVLYLCSDMAAFITGENICIDGGMTRQMIYHGDCGWSFDLK
jgi:NAD(P)-dependent dehydrogenase (short-subunit alcohol dehydrogenase family)